MERFADWWSEWWREWRWLIISLAVTFGIMGALIYAGVTQNNIAWESRKKAYFDCIHDGAKWVQIQKDGYVCDRSRVE